jgi:hypothetical protein
VGAKREQNPGERCPAKWERLNQISLSRVGSNGSMDVQKRKEFGQTQYHGGTELMC